MQLDIETLLYCPEAFRAQQSRAFDEAFFDREAITNTVIKMLHPLVSPLDTSERRAIHDYQTNPLFQATVRHVVAIMWELKTKPRIEEI